jgi:hypothetical protein
MTAITIPACQLASVFEMAMTIFVGVGSGASKVTNRRLKTGTMNTIITTKSKEMTLTTTAG